MIAKSAWFKRRKYGGWGVTPKTWQGGVYITIMILLLVVFQILPFWSTKVRMYGTLIWAALLMLDLVPVMITLQRDEREHKNEAVAERNAAWFMSLILVIGVLYEVIISALNESFQVNLFVAIALFGGALVKTISNIYLDKKGV